MEATKLSPQELANVVTYVAERRMRVSAAINALKELSHSASERLALPLNDSIYALVLKLEEEETRLRNLGTETINSQYL